MKLVEVFDSRQDLHWREDGIDNLFTDFEIDGRRYGISISLEDADTLKFARVDFHFRDDAGNLHHEATGFNKDAGKILGIVGNGVKEKFASSIDGFWFVAKRDTNSQDEFSARIKIYNRLSQKLGASYHFNVESRDLRGHYVFLVYRNTAALETLEKFL